MGSQNWAGLDTLSERLSGLRVVLAGAAVVAVAAWLPWARIESIGTVTGIDGDGFLTLMLSTAIAGLLGTREWGRIEQAAVAVIGLLVLALVWKFVTDPATPILASGDPNAAGKSLSPVYGLYLTVFGGITIVGGSLWAAVGDG
ncbi:hypothetical protein Hrd1104_08505 [Halorhabdus sp. CBA1104]|jgi:hypothetical protein|uniref:hypothetical protein n=1 Tax=unclassified Halorhabdus TaxID=2621901 RepID=UPI0012B2D462|nr:MULTISPECIES: hypothetical protein [unclassified Halorhabdus]QGN07341.1 hypothetical protein Hrd1104_08505 [Halorhabdus sp. CBA1104]